VRKRPGTLQVREAPPTAPPPAPPHFWAGAWCAQARSSAVMADSGSGVRLSLLQLQESLSASDRCSAAVASCQLLRGLGQECVLSSGPALLGGYGSSLPSAGPAWATRAVFELGPQNL